MILSILSVATIGIAGQPRDQAGEWRTYGADLASTRYSPLDQIDGANFSSLEVAWRFKTDNLGPRPEFNLQATPLMVKGVLYTTGGTRRAVAAVAGRLDRQHPAGLAAIRDDVGSPATAEEDRVRAAAADPVHRERDILDIGELGHFVAHSGPKRALRNRTTPSPIPISSPNPAFRSPSTWLRC